MWNARLISGVVCGSVAIVTYAQAANAARSQDYSPAQFISVLNGLGYAVQLDAPITDPRVQQAIRDFQVQYALPVDGTLNNPTQDKAAEIVRSLQSGLNRVVKPSPQLPGSQFYGRQTEAAVKQFQQQNRLPITGTATLETRRRLNAILNDEDPLTPPTTPSTPTTPTIPAERSQLSIYTEPQTKAILAGFGYDINPQAPLGDPATVRAIRDLQRLYGLSETGAINRDTEEQLSRVMRNLRNNLKLILRSNFAIAQYYDAATRAAVEQFQSRYSLRVNGIASLAVRSRIDAEARRIRSRS
ncbi:peptidoglycan-binding domain-containing protein [Leptolyngbya sp. FACHB-17]|uniref:peptidoglycan-binding domain-containing protein n=1 Tax=unclassified Leptolyngbya TaxID=2650499 RepID=UPI0016813973|nr:peptidoglycan-binding domain-containing protein [Leptolyngbya sp. FACHB-17]MBD2083152.1 peptidoglycan-binding protein [Leptolyngbya sp. FACHB-17]